MTTVSGNLLGAANPQRVEMKATLVDVTGKAAVGYVASEPGELVRPVIIAPGEDGAWSVSLIPNAAITSQAGDTLWAIQEGRAKDGAPIVSYVAVPDTGTWWVGSILADLSSTQTGDSTVVYLAAAPGANGADGASAYQVAVTNGFSGSQAQWLASLVGPKGDQGEAGAGGAVDSVNGLDGVVVLDAAAVNADPAGAAAAAQAAAVSAAATDAAARVATHTSATDPHGDRAAAASALAGHMAAFDPHGDRAVASAALAAHEADTTGVHGITDTAALETTTGAQAKATAAQTAATTAAASDATAKVSAHTAASDPHGDRAAASSALTTHVGASDPHGDRAAAASALSTHAADTTDVHGITDTAALETTTGAQAKATAAQSAATSAAATDATSKVSTHAGATDPHGDRSWADSKFATQLDLTTLNGTVNSLSATVTTIDGFLNDCLTRVAAIEQGTAYLAGGHFTDDVDIAEGSLTLNSTGTAIVSVNRGATSNFAGVALKTGGAERWAMQLINDGTNDLLVTDTANGVNVVRVVPHAARPAVAIAGSLAVTGHALGQDTPAAHGIAAWAYDPALAVNSTELTGGVLYLVRVNIAANVTATKIYWWVANTGSGPTTGRNEVGLYDSSGNLLTATNVDSAISSATLKTTTITGQALTAGSFYWIGMVFNASVLPTLARASGWTGVDAAANLGLTAATYRFAKNGTGRTVLPSTITPSSNTGTDFAGPWAAVGA